MGTALIVVAGLVLYFAPYTIPELTGPFASYEIVDPATPDLAAGHMIDDYWAVQSSAHCCSTPVREPETISAASSPRSPVYR